MRPTLVGLSVPGENVLGMEQMTEAESAVLAFEQTWWQQAGSKDAAIRERFDLTSVRYYQVLNVLIDKPAAMAADPLVVRRLRRLRDTRLRERTARRLGFDAV